MVAFLYVVLFSKTSPLEKLHTVVCYLRGKP